ncbi:MAG: Txe/YoeB family addiction module toxin [Synergistaceae bacterium]|jgi:toxin YoeB|nr:Txe/YoeB family addiction module toxin [Synergistaceae bacterium]
MRKAWSDEAWNDYEYWQAQDRKTLQKINKLLRSIERDGERKGEGKPEPLKGELSGYCRRKIDGKNCLVYRVVDEGIEILACRDHYEDK